jgi:LPXTG-motif cell wall-anchored protein
LQKTTVSYMQSLQLLYRMQKKNSMAEEAALFGMGSDRNMGNGLNPIANATTEVQMAVDYMGGKVALNEDATETMFKVNSTLYLLLHLSTHGVVFTQNPLASYLLFHADPSAAEDGKITAFEIGGMDLHAELAVLSACGTADGRPALGSGVLSLGRSFQDAGCANVIMTLKDVGGTMSETLMNRFYQHLAEGKDIAQSFCLARRDFLKDSPDDSEALPHHWAPFILQGPGGHTILPQTAGYSYLWWVGLGMVLVVVFWIVWRRRRRKRVDPNCPCLHAPSC